jgi:hypothetical protein
MDAYVFSARKGSDTFAKIKALAAHVRYATELDSDSDGYSALSFVEGKDQDELERRLEAVRKAVNPPSTDTAVASGYGPLAPTRWSPKPRYAAYVRVKVQPGSADGVLERTAALATYWGSATVTGSYAIFLELGADSVEALDADVDKLGRIEGVASHSHGKAPNKPKDTWMK